MIEINKNKLIPAITATWGDITGNIEKQQDLMSLMSSFATESWVSSQNYLTSSSLKTINNQSIVGEGNIEIEASVPDYYATKAWVSEQGYLTSETLPSDIATEEWVSSQGYITTSALSGYATESWVSSQGYLTSVPDSFATKAWVSDQGYLTSETLPSDLATESWVVSQGYITTSALSGYATESWVSSQGYLTSVPDTFATKAWVSDQGYLTSVPSEFATKSWVSEQGYLTSVPDLFATKAWVSDQGYLTSETLPSDIATQSWVLSQGFASAVDLSVYATQDWVNEQGFAYWTNVLNQNYASQSWVLDQNFASKSDCILNQVNTPYGPFFEAIGGAPELDFRNYFTTPSGRMFCVAWGELYEWDPTQNDFVPVVASVIPDLPDGGYIYKTENNLFYIDQDYTYIWDDNNSDWTQITSAPTNYDFKHILITQDDTLRCSDGTKLTENNGVWSWIQSAMTDTFMEGRSILVGQDVYVFGFDEWSETDPYVAIFKYSESMTTYEYVASCEFNPVDNIFTVNGQLFVVDNIGVSVMNVDHFEETNIHYNDNIGATCAYVTYNNILWTVDSDMETYWDFGTCGSVSYSVPEVPSTNGTYVLKAVRTSSGVTYSWVADEVPQAVQITNEILS